jgi:hypothetical protein
MGELKDRDRELSDMMTSHQQQLVAWQQDRDRLVMLERKCIQHEGMCFNLMDPMYTYITVNIYFGKFKTV